jgi:hydrogenase expression/formation protein HypC
MCLAVPGKVVKIEKNKATIDYIAEKRTADLSLLKPKIGDYVIVNAGFVISKVPKKEAIEALKLFMKKK